MAKILRLARQLGLVETLYANESEGTSSTSSQQKQQQVQLSYQRFEHILIVDFATTCWEKEAPPKWREPEIIEFSAVMLNLKTGKVVSEFQKYIMPIESPKLSKYCTELTGITQDKVDNGIPLQTALMVFQEWVRKELKLHNLYLPKMHKDDKLGNCAFATWSDRVFEQTLLRECVRKRLKKPQFFNQWINIKSIFSRYYKCKPSSFVDALNHVGMKFEGHENCGLSNAKNIARLVYQLTRDGASLMITQDLTPSQHSINFSI